MSLDVKFNKPYCSGLLASTDLHAGGILFGYVYSECLTFNADQTVLQTYNIIDTFAQADNEAESRSNEKNTGLCKINSRGYIECDFEKILYTGVCAKATLEF